MSAEPEVQPSRRADDQRKEVVVNVLVDSFDIFVRAVAEIAAELNLRDELSVEALMAYWLSLPEADTLVRDFIQGDLSLVPLKEQTRQMVERDLGRLELEPARSALPTAAGTGLGKKLDARRRTEAAEKIDQSKGSALQKFMEENPEVLRQVAGCSHEFLAMWVMLYLMHAARARERGHRAASECRQFAGENPALQRDHRLDPNPAPRIGP